MHLTPPTPIGSDNIAINAYDLARCVTSLPDSSPFVTLRWGAVKEADMLAYLTASFSNQIEANAQIPRISASKTDGKGDELERSEHLVIRDLDLVPCLFEENPSDYEGDGAVRKSGRIIAHAEYRFRPKGWNLHKSRQAFEQINGKQPEISKPEGAKVELIERFDDQVEQLLDYHCNDRRCFELVNISTAATHLRKGLAKQLVSWLFPFCDAKQLDYILVASPMGRKLYQNCGFVEEGIGDKWAVEIDMGKWGGDGTHQHVYMVRHPMK